MRAQCYCAAYRFPHRASGGACPANARQPQRLCAACGMPANPTKVDFGIGRYEFWGQCGIHRDVRTVSDCCEDDLIDNDHRALVPPTPSPATTTGVSK